MAEVQLLESRDVAPGEVSATKGGRLRPVSEAGVEAVRASLRETGRILSPVWLRRVKGDRLELLDGAHRLAAASAEGLVTVPALVFRCTDRQARLLEIDGNLAGAELTALDTAVFLAARKRIYEEMHPETKAGGWRGNQHTGGWQTELSSFCQSAAEKMGKTERQVRKIAAAGASLGPDEVAKLRRAPRPVTLADLQAIGKIGNPPERYHVVDALAEGRVKNAAAGRAEWKVLGGNAAPPPSPVDDAHRKLLALFDRAPMAAKRRFVRDRMEALMDLIEDGQDGGGA